MEPNKRFEQWKSIMVALHEAVKTGNKDSYMSNYEKLEDFLEANDPDTFTVEQAQLIGRGYKLAALARVAFESGVFGIIATEPSLA